MGVYVITYVDKPKGQQVAAASYMNCASDTEAGLVWAGIGAFMAADNRRNMNTVLIREAPTGAAVSSSLEARLHILFADGSLGFLHVPHVLETNTLADFEGALGIGSGTPLLNAAGSAAASIVKIEYVNPQ